MPFASNGTWYAYPSPAGNSSFTDLIKYGNTITGDVFSLIILTGVFMVIFIVGSSRDPDAALASSALVTTMISFVFVSMGIMSNWIAVTMVFVLMLSIVLLYYKGGEKSV